ncbi:PAS domain S-box protein [Dehalococcoides mccartyi]|uniref:PAS domain S-box protein n=1 Tax=Dehalococcoides mccartyi TaxID=61435 RepID=UPI003395FBED
MQDRYKSCRTNAEQRVLPESACLAEILSMIESTRTMAFIFETSPQFRLIYASSNTPALSGYLPADYLSNPALLDEILKPAGLNLDTRTPKQFKTPLGPIPCYIPSKTGLPLSGELLCKLSSGKLICLIHCHGQVQNNPNQLAFFDEAPTLMPLIISFEPDGKLLFANRIFEEATGYPAGEISGDKWQSCGLFSEEARERIVRNIRQRKEAEKHLKFTSFSMEHSADLIIWVNQNGNIIGANRSAYQSLGYTHDELCSLTVEDINPVCTPERWKTLWGRLKHDIKYAMETALITKNGQKLPIDVMCNFLEFEGVDYCCAVVRNITERKNVYAKLLHAAEEWRITFDNISEIVFLLDNDFNIQRANRAFAKALNCQPQEILNKKCYEVLHHTNCPQVNCPKLVASDTQKTQYINYFEETIEKHFQETIDPILDTDGQSLGTVHILKDLTEHHKMAAQLMITDRLASVGEMAAGLAHELNNPLTSVIGFSELLQEKKLPEDLQRDIQIISQEALRAAEVIRNLLAFARRHEPSKDWVDMNVLIHKVLDICNYEQRVNNIHIVTNLDADLPEIKADYFQMQQVLLNIIINAEYFITKAHGEGTIVISSSRFGDNIRISIKDDGPGMSENVLNRIFDPFFTTKEVGKGTGLGLSIGHGIITQHGGKLYAESSEGKGATFFIELPINPPAQ